jgi:hypothetical protein
MSADAIAMNQGTVHLTPDGVDITRLVRLHRLYHGKPIMTHIRALRALRGQPNERPDSTDHAIGHAWRAADAQVEQEQNDRRPYRGSREEARHRSNRRWNGRR